MIDTIIAFIFGLMVGAGAGIVLVALFIAGENDHEDH